MNKMDLGMAFQRLNDEMDTHVCKYLDGELTDAEYYKEFWLRLDSLIRDYLDDGKHIIHFPTKKHWKNQSQYQYIEEGLDTLHRLCLEIPNGAIIAIPQLGCGLGGLDWSRVHKLIVKYLSDIKHLTFYIYGPNITN